MAKCGLVQIDGHAFGGLNNLVELDLSQNQLKQVRRESVKENSSRHFFKRVAYFRRAVTEAVALA